jgi:hypothetical protein
MLTLAYAARTFSTTEAGTGRTRHGLSLGPRSKNLLASGFGG